MSNKIKATIWTLVIMGIFVSLTFLENCSRYEDVHDPIAYEEMKQDQIDNKKMEHLRDRYPMNNREKDRKFREHEKEILNQAPAPNINEKNAIDNQKHKSEGINQK